MGIISWLYSIGLPQYAAEILYLCYRQYCPVDNEGESEWAGYVKTERIEASTLISTLSAPPEHKIKMLYELEQLKYIGSNPTLLTFFLEFNTN